MSRLDWTSENIWVTTDHGYLLQCSDRAPEDFIQWLYEQILPYMRSREEDKENADISEEDFLSVLNGGGFQAAPQGSIEKQSVSDARCQAPLQKGIGAAG